MNNNNHNEGVQHNNKNVFSRSILVHNRRHGQQTTRKLFLLSEHLFQFVAYQQYGIMKRAARTRSSAQNECSMLTITAYSSVFTINLFIIIVV